MYTERDTRPWNRGYRLMRERKRKKIKREKEEYRTRYEAL